LQKNTHVSRTATQYYSSLHDSCPPTEAGRQKALFVSKGLTLIGG